MNKERGILFKPEMMVALLSGKKTQTRRLVSGTALEWLGDIGFDPAFVCDKDNHLCPYGYKGDILWTRESIGYPLDGGAVIYRADGGFATLPDFAKKVLKKGRWTPSIHQPKIYSRAKLLINDIRIERLQDITDENARAEGFEGVTEFANYIDEINGLETWDNNLWVWVIDFELMKGIES